MWRVNEKQRCLAVAKHAVCHSTKCPAADACLTMSRHDDQVALASLRRFDDAGGGISIAADQRANGAITIP